MIRQISGAPGAAVVQWRQGASNESAAAATTRQKWRAVAGGTAPVAQNYQQTPADAQAFNAAWAVGANVVIGAGVLG